MAKQRVIKAWAIVRNGRKIREVDLLKTQAKLSLMKFNEFPEPTLKNPKYEIKPCEIRLK